MTTLERAARAVLAKTNEGAGVSFFYRRKTDKSAYEVVQDDGGDCVPYEGYPSVFEGNAEECADKARELNSVEIARAVLMAVRDQGLSIYHASDPASPFPEYAAAEGFADMIDAILE